MTDHNEAMRLADWHAEQAHGWRNAASFSAADKAEPVRSSLLEKAAFHDKAAALLRQQAERELALMAERDQHQATATALIALLADIRKACGDNGKRMQPELVEFIGSMKAEHDQLRAEVERLSKTDAEILACNYPDGEENGPTISAPDYELIGFARQLGIRDAARTTHKETE